MSDDEDILGDVQKKFSEKFEDCSKCRVVGNREIICRRHKAMVAKYVREKHDTKIKDMAKILKDMMQNKNENQ